MKIKVRNINDGESVFVPLWSVPFVVIAMPFMVVAVVATMAALLAAACVTLPIAGLIWVIFTVILKIIEWVAR